MRLQNSSEHYTPLPVFSQLRRQESYTMILFPSWEKCLKCSKILGTGKLLGETKGSSHMCDWVGNRWQKERRGNDSSSYQGVRCLLFLCSLNKDGKAPDLQLNILNCFIRGFKFYFYVRWRTSDWTIVWGFYLPWPECLSMGLSLAGSKLLIELRHTDCGTRWAMQRSRAGRAKSHHTAAPAAKTKNQMNFRNASDRAVSKRH